MSSRRGTGMVYRPTYRDKKAGEKKQQKVWWVQYSIGGKRERESTGTTVHGEAVRFLHQRLAERGRGISRRDLEKVKFADLAAAIRADYAKNRRKSARRLETSLIHLSTAFDGWRVVDIAEDVIDRYAADRLSDGAAPASINRELAALRRMFKLGRRARLAGYIPAFQMLAEDNVRTGFVVESELAALVAELPPHLRPLTNAAYVTGWRKEELLSRTWANVDFGHAGWIRLEPGETKNGKGRQFPLILRLREILEAQREKMREIERSTDRIGEHVFFHYDNGNRIGDFRKSWKSACKTCRATGPGLPRPSPFGSPQPGKCRNPRVCGDEADGPRDTLGVQALRHRQREDAGRADREADGFLPRDSRPAGAEGYTSRWLTAKVTAKVGAKSGFLQA